MLQTVYKIDTISRDPGAVLFNILMGCCFSLDDWPEIRNIRHSYLDFVDNIECISVTRLSKVYLCHGICKPIAVVSCSRKGRKPVSEICVWILDFSVTPQDYESGDANTANSQAKELRGNVRRYNEYSQE
jgi:hypothetical protein